MLDLNGVMSMAQRNLKRDGFIQPVLFVETDDDSGMVIRIAFDSPDEKVLMVRLAGSAAREHCAANNCKVLSVVMLSDAWVRVLAKDEPIPDKVEGHPEATEAIVVFGLDVNGDAHAAQTPYVRVSGGPDDGDIIFEEPITDSDAVSADARLLKHFYAGYEGRD